MFLVSFGIFVFCRSLRENCGIYVESQRSGKRSLQGHSSMGVRADVVVVLLKPSELERTWSAHECTRQLTGVATSTQGNQSHSSMGVRVDMVAVLLKPSELERTWSAHECTRQLAGVATSTQGNQSIRCASHCESARAQPGVRSSAIAQTWQNWADATFFPKMVFFFFNWERKKYIFFFALCRCI